MAGDDEDDDDGALDAPSGARAFWSGTISFGLVSIPVDLFAAARPARTPLRMLAPDGAPLRREYYCPEDGAALEAEDLVRGRTVDGKVVVVSDEELEALAPERSRDIDLRRFVPRAELDPLLFDRGYLLGPAGESTKAYRLLAATMERTGQAGLATFVMRGKEYLVAILADGGRLRAETLRFADEVRTPEDVGLPAAPERVDAGARRRLAAALDALEGDEAPLDALSDPQAGRLRALAEAKRAKGEGVVEVEEGEEVPAPQGVDLMARISEGLARERPRRARSKRELLERAKALGIRGRSAMSRDELERAVERAEVS
ncbi:MAG: Ku protein [Planctomycetes bacterium]|nr:Ku protein [Planctomycetota bacterium]